MLQHNNKKLKIIAPSSLDDDPIKQLEEFKSKSINYGFDVFYNEKAFLEKPLFPFLASTKNIMYEDFIDAITADYDYILGFRGGYGSIITVSEIIKNNISPKNNAVFIGFSDHTSIHMLYNIIYNRCSIHYSSLNWIVKNDLFDEFFNFIQSEFSTYDLNPINIANSNIIESKIIGGNLRVFSSSINNFDIAPNSILLFEDINEKSYSIFRDIFQLKNSMIFDKISAVIFCEFTNSDEFLDETLEKIGKYIIPEINTYRLKNIGHVKENIPIMFGNSAKIKNNKMIVKNLM